MDIIKVDAWICPRCLVIDTELGSHVQHLHQDDRCLIASLDPRRKGAMCRCYGQVRCVCLYRVNSRG